MRILTLAALLLLAPLLAPPWYRTLDFASAERELTTSPVVRIRPLKAFLEEEFHFQWEGSNDLFLVDLANGMRAVFRTEDKPWGSTAEVSGYRFARYLGSRLVPPTVRRTLARGPKGWAWSTDTRFGSVQLFIEASGHPDALPRLTAKERSDVEVISFVFGRYDNHSGNLLLDPAGGPVMIDFEGSMNPQQVRYGEVPFVKHGGRFHAEDGVPGTKPFPFDHPRVLVDPSLDTIKQTFGPWWNQTWPTGMDMLHRIAQQVPGRRIPYAIWDDQLWVQLDAPKRHAAHTDVYSRATIDRLEALTEDRLVHEILGPEYRVEHIRGIMDRRRQLLAAARHGRFIP